MQSQAKNETAAVHLKGLAFASTRRLHRKAAQALIRHYFFIAN
jgi:hypothetical protein